MPTYAAVDLGATSGRIVNVAIDSERIVLDPVHRFQSPTVSGPNGALHWDMNRMRSEIEIGLSRAAERAVLRSVAIDSWAVDYGLLDTEGQPMGAVHAYRSRRTDGVMESVVSRLGRPASTSSPVFSSCRSTPSINCGAQPRAANLMLRRSF